MASKRNHRKKPVRPRQQTGANACAFSFVDGALLQISGPIREQYLVQFIDPRNNEIVHQDHIQTNAWIKAARQYYTPWQIRVRRADTQELVFNYEFDCKNQRVYIAIESRALGDTLAWFHYLEEFRCKHECHLICSTFMNDLFKDQYPHIEFIEPGETAHNLYAMYRIGWFYDENGDIDYHRNVRNFRFQALGATACDILGLDYRPQRPRLPTPETVPPISNHYVCIGFHSTTQAKYWNNPEGWAAVINYLNQRGYQVILLSKEGKHYMGNCVPEGVIDLPPGSIKQVIHYLQHAKLFIGIGSGLSWLSWAAGCKTCLISGFSYPYTETDDVVRIFPEDAGCTGCFNRHRLDPNNWNWCPDQSKLADRFQCTRSISAKQVINAIAPYLE